MGQAGSTVEQVTAEERKVIEEIWGQVMGDAQGSGELILNTYFSRYPQYYDKFVKFRQLPREEIPQSAVFKRHALGIVTTLNEVVSHLDNHEELWSSLLKLGKMHGKRNLNQQQFYELKDVIIDIFRDQLKVGEDGIKAWNKVIDIAYKYIFKGLEEEEKRTE